MPKKNHWETHLYTYATMLKAGARILPENLKAMRAKAIKFGHTEGECMLVEANPNRYISTGRLAAD